MNYIANDRALILKTRLGNGESAVDVEWKDDRQVWVVSSRSFSLYWFEISETGKKGYDIAMKAADQLEPKIQRMIRYRRQEETTKNEIMEFVTSFKQNKSNNA